MCCGETGMVCCCPWFRSGLRLVGEYLLGKQLGMGCFGKVKRGVHCDTGEVVALKIVPRGMAMKGYLSELAALQKLDHPHIVHIKFATSTCLYPRRYGGSVEVAVIGMELARGTVGKCMEVGGAFHPTAAMGLFHQLIEALAHCHNHGIYHRDVKPSNLLVSNDHRLLLGDFGLATDAPHCRHFCGTPMYMAPELGGGTLYDGALADVWSAGLCLYNFLTGDHPYVAADPFDQRFMMISRGEWSAYWKRELYRPPRGARDLLAIVLKVPPKERPTATTLLAFMGGYDCGAVARELGRRV